MSQSFGVQTKRAVRELHIPVTSLSLTKKTNKPSNSYYPYNKQDRIHFPGNSGWSSCLQGSCDSEVEYRPEGCFGEAVLGLLLLTKVKGEGLLTKHVLAFSFSLLINCSQLLSHVLGSVLQLLHSSHALQRNVHKPLLPNPCHL